MTLTGLFDALRRRGKDPEQELIKLWNTVAVRYPHVHVGGECPWKPGTYLWSDGTERGVAPGPSDTYPADPTEMQPGDLTSTDGTHLHVEARIAPNDRDAFVSAFEWCRR